MVSSVMTQSSSSNCSEYVDRFLLSLRGNKDTTPVTTPLPVTTQPQHPPSDTIAMCMLMLQDASFSLQENNVLTYIAGYIVRKLQDNVCGACKGKLVATIDPADPHHQLLAAKAHSGCVVGLSAPSCLLVGCVDLLEAHYRDVVDGFISGERVKARISTSLLEGVDLAILKCDVCHMESMVVHLMVNIRFHHTLREYNRHLRDNKSRKNRKTLKVCHV